MAGAADVALNVEIVVKVKGEGGIEGCGVRDAAAGAGDRLVGVVGGVGGISLKTGGDSVRPVPWGGWAGRRRSFCHQVLRLR